MHDYSIETKLTIDSETYAVGGISTIWLYPSFIVTLEDTQFDSTPYKCYASDLTIRNSFITFSVISPPSPFAVTSFPLLQHLHISKRIKPDVSTISFSNLRSLLTLRIDEDCFTRCRRTEGTCVWSSQYGSSVITQQKSFEVVNCPSLQSISIGNGSLQDVVHFELKGRRKRRRLNTRSACVRRMYYWFG